MLRSETGRPELLRPLSEQKGYDRLLRVFNKLKKEGFNLELILVGSGEKYNELNNNINNNINEESKNKIINEYINKFLSMKEPSRELIINLIDKIEIFEDKTININVSFSNFYNCSK